MNFFPKLIAHPIALDASLCTLASKLNSFPSSSVLGPIDGVVNGSKRARELYLSAETIL